MAIDGENVKSSIEIGHTLFPYHGDYREFEHICSGNGLKAIAKDAGLEVVHAGEIFAAAKKGDEKSKTIIDEWLSSFSSFIEMIQNLYEPEVIVFTGGVMKSSDYFFDDLRKLSPNSRLEKCHFGEEAGLYGAAYYGFKKTK